MGQTAAGVAGVAHGVQGVTGESWSALHEAVDRHVVRHVGGHQERADTLREKMVGQFESPFILR